MKKSIAVLLFLTLPCLGTVQFSFTNFAGLPGYFNSGTSDGDGISARFTNPAGIAVDASGNVFVADQYNSTIRKITPGGTVSTLAGDPTFTGAQDGTNRLALFSQPMGVAVDTAGNLFVADTLNSTIRKVTPVGTNWVVTTIAGLAGYSACQDGTNNIARFNNPAGLAVDTAGNVFVADTYNSVIRKITPAGTNWVVTTIAGSPMEFGNQDGTNNMARFAQPVGVAVDQNGNLYVSDTFNFAIRKIVRSANNWVVTTLAASMPAFSMIAGLTVDGSGNVFVADQGNYTIQRVTETGTISLVGGSYGQYGTTDGTAGAARFYGPMGVTVDGSGNLYVADSVNNRISKGIPSLTITSSSPLPAATVHQHYRCTLSAIGGRPPYSWAIVSSGLPAGLSLTATNGVISGTPTLVTNASFTVQVTDTNSQTTTSLLTLAVVAPSIPLITSSSPLPDGTAGKPYEYGLTALGGMLPRVWTLVGGWLAPGLVLSTNGVVSGTPDAVTNTSFSVRVAGQDGLASTNTFILCIVPPPPPSITTASNLPEGKTYVAYSKTLTATGGSGPYTWSLASGELPAGLTLASNGVISGVPLEKKTLGFGVRVTGNDSFSSVKLFSLTVRAPDSGYFFANYAGRPGSSGAGTNDGTRSAATFNGPQGLAMDAAGNLFVSDTYNYTIRKIETNGLVSTIAGLPQTNGSDDGTSALFSQPAGLVIDDAGSLYVVDAMNNAVRKISLQGSSWVTTTIAGDGVNGHADGTNRLAQFNMPMGIARDFAGNLYVADSFNCSIRKVSPTGTNWVVTTIAGSNTAWGNADGTNSAARFSNPQGIAVDATGNLFVADTMNHTIRKITPAGTNWVVTTIAGDANFGGGWSDGTNSTAQFFGPSGVAVDGAGNLYITESLSFTIRKITPVGTNWITTTLGGMSTVSGTDDGMGSAARFSEPRGIALDAGNNLFIADAANNRISKGILIGPPTITSTGTLPPGLAGAAYAQALSATGGRAPLTWTLSGGYLPPGLSLGSEGVISGVPTAGMRVTFTARVTGADGLWAEQPLTLTVVPMPGQRYSYYTWTNFAGRSGHYGYADGVRQNARFHEPRGVACDTRGNLYVADTLNHTIRKMDLDGTVVTIAGKPGQPGNTNGYGEEARFHYPSDLDLDGSGNLYVADTGNHLIRKITTDGLVSTLAGSPSEAGYTNGMGSQARFNSPIAVRMDGSGNAFVSDTGNHVIRKVSPEGIVTTYAGVMPYGAGGAEAGGYADGIATTAKFKNPRGLALDGNGNLFVADNGNVLIRKITPSGLATTVAGQPGQQGVVNGPAAEARFLSPTGLEVDEFGNLYVTDDQGMLIRKISTEGMVTTLAGQPYGWGATDGVGTNGLFNRPWGLTLDNSNQLFFADSGNNTIRKMSTNEEVTTVAGRSWILSAGHVDGWGENARFYFPASVAVDQTGNVYVGAQASVRKISPPGMVTTVAGSPGFVGYTDGTNGEARFGYEITGIAVGPDGNIYLSDTYNQTIRKVTPEGVVTTLAGDPTIRDSEDYSHAVGGYVDGTNRTARFSSPSGVAVDGNGNVFVADTWNFVIRKVTPSGGVTTFAGARTIGYADGPTGVAQFNRPTGLGIDAQGNLYVADTHNHTIRKITPAGVVSTLAGSPGEPGSTDGINASARFSYPSAVAVDVSGNVFVADAFNNVIRKMTHEGANWVVTTIGGEPGVTGDNDGQGSQAKFNLPYGIAVSPEGLLYVSDVAENRIIKGVSVSSPSITAPSALPSGLINVPYQQTLGLSGGVPPYTWYFTQGSLPAGLSFTNGVISGTVAGVTNLSFTVCVIGADGLAFANVFNLAITVAPAQLQLYWSDGQPHLIYSGSVGGTYVLQSSTNLIEWQSLATNTLPALGTLSITNLPSQNIPSQFFRAVSP